MDVIIYVMDHFIVIIYLYIYLAAAGLVAVPEDIRFDGVEATFLSLVDEIGPHLRCHLPFACAVRVPPGQTTQ